MKEAFIIIGSHYGIATFIDFKSKTVCNVYLEIKKKTLKPIKNFIN